MVTAEHVRTSTAHAQHGTVSSVSQNVRLGYRGGTGIYAFRAVIIIRARHTGMGHSALNRALEIDRNGMVLTV